jgi:hypothetical protein|nr:MAG TPA: DNA pilot protein [Microviridae sp.]
MAFDWASLAGGAANLGGSAVSAYFSWKHQKEVMKNRHQWEVEDLRKAGLNPILSAGGSGSPGNAPIIEAPDIAGSAAKAVEASLGRSQEDLIKAQTQQSVSSARQAESQTALNKTEEKRVDFEANRSLEAVGTQALTNYILKEQWAQEKLKTANSALETERHKMAFDYMKEHSGAWSFGQWMQLLNPFGTSAPVVNSAVGAARLAK